MLWPLPTPTAFLTMEFIAEVGGASREGAAGGLLARHPWGACPYKHAPYHPGSPTPSVLLTQPTWRGVLETFLELVQQPSCKVVLAAALLLGGGSLMLWVRRRRRKRVTECVGRFYPTESCNPKNEDWIKSHFSRLSDEKLEANNTAVCPPVDCGNGEASTTIHVETFTTRHGEGGTALHRESFTSRQRTSGSSLIKETHKESGKSSSTDEATWAAVAACTKEIDSKGRQLANSMLQRATAYQHTGHVETKDINQEELKALEEVEMKVQGSFLVRQENTTAGSKNTHTFPGHGHQKHQGHPGQPGLQGHPSHPGRQGHPSRQGNPGHQGHQGHPGHLTHQSHQSHSLPNGSHQICDSFEAT
ncbi:uncharacterized protein C10orf62 homolog [Tamandua tetradactyla]|uniref:uncharacterized protein C10orf62 homolog n=1 Tax=Tamandua tetradactyla TaxID=48850 RepID=UPI0040544799